MADVRRLRAPLVARLSGSSVLSLPLRRKADTGRFAGPRGLGIPAFNLLSDGGSEPPPHGRPAAVAAAGLAALVVASGLGWAYAWASADLAETRASYDAARVKLAALDVPVAPPAEKSLVRLREERDLRKTALASALSTRIAWDRVLREVSLVIPEDVWLTSLSANVQPESAPDSASAAAAASTKLLVDGYTRSQRSVARLLARLSIVPAFRSVQLLGSTRTVVAKQEVFKFSLAATLKSPERPT